jgi:hypothetical protein
VVQHFLRGEEEALKRRKNHILNTTQNAREGQNSLVREPRREYTAAKWLSAREQAASRRGLEGK